MKTKKLFIILLLLLATLLTGCKNDNNGTDDDSDNDSKVIVEKYTKTLLTGTIYETTVYYFKTNVEGPKILIVGGIHGDELAGWHAATRMLEYDFTFGEVIIIPRANILATQLEQRYPGQKNNGNYNGVQYSDLNRAFPGKANGTPTEQIAYVLATFIDQEDPDIVLDLHESLNNYLNPPYIGNQVIAGNPKSAFYAMSLVAEFNQKYQTPNNVPFIKDEKPKDGSINQYCSQDQNRIVFTFETDRSLKLEERIRQQLTLIDIFLNQIKPS